MSPNVIDSPVVVLNAICVEMDFFDSTLFSCHCYLTNCNLHHLDYGLQPPNSRPNTTNTDINASATCGGVSGVDSTAVAVTNTAEAAHK